MTKYLIIILAFYFKEIKAQNYVLIPDANFRAYLQSIIPSAMSGNSLNTTNTLVTINTQTISVSSQSISNLNGVQYFSSLNYLDCSLNFLSSLPVLSNFLVSLNCANNSLTALPALNNSLLYLVCNNNSLTSLPSLPFGIQKLTCDYNSLNNLPPLSNSLITLSCVKNSLISLPTLPNSLQQLYCDNNNISCFPAFPQALVSISLSNNPYNCLPNYVLPLMNSYTTTPICSTGNSNGCAVVGIRNLSPIKNQINIFPNPTIGKLNLEVTEFDLKNTTLTIINQLGQIVMQSAFKPEIDFSNFSSGVYYLKIQSSSEQKVIKILKE